MSWSRPFRFREVRECESAHWSECLQSLRRRYYARYKTKYRLQNWPTYDRALVRGDLTIWFTPERVQKVIQQFDTRRPTCSVLAAFSCAAEPFSGVLVLPAAHGSGGH